MANDWKVTQFKLFGVKSHTGPKQAIKQMIKKIPIVFKVTIMTFNILLLLLQNDKRK
jgi:hypothetical protein